MVGLTGDPWTLIGATQTSAFGFPVDSAHNTIGVTYAYAAFA